MIKGMQGLGEIFKQAEAMQEKLAQLQGAVESLEVEGHAGGQLVSVVLNGKGEMMRLSLDSSLYTEDPGDREILEDLIVAAFNDAREKLQTQKEEKTSQLMGGLPLPPGFKLPF